MVDAFVIVNDDFFFSNLDKNLSKSASLKDISIFDSICATSSLFFQEGQVYVCLLYHYNCQSPFLNGTSHCSVKSDTINSRVKSCDWFVATQASTPNRPAVSNSPGAISGFTR